MWKSWGSGSYGTLLGVQSWSTGHWDSDGPSGCGVQRRRLQDRVLERAVNRTVSSSLLWMHWILESLTKSMIFFHDNIIYTENMAREWHRLKITIFCRPCGCMQKKNQSFAKNFHYIPLFLYIKLSKCEKAATKWAERQGAWLRGKVLAFQHEELVVSFQDNDQWVGRSVQRNRKDDSSQTWHPSASVSRSLIVETTGKGPRGSQEGAEGKLWCLESHFPFVFHENIEAPNNDKSYLTTTTKTWKNLNV